MNVDIIAAVYKVPRGIISTCEKAVLLAVAAHVPTFDEDGRPLRLVEKFREPAKVRKENDFLFRSNDDSAFGHYAGMYLNAEKYRTGDESRLKVKEGNAAMRISDILANDEPLTIATLSELTGFSENSVRTAKQSLIERNLLQVKNEKGRQYWIVNMFEVRSSSSKKVSVRKCPNRARPNVVKMLKSRAEHKRIEAERTRVLKEKEKRERDNLYRSLARKCKMSIRDFKAAVGNGSITINENGEVEW